jgi:hypothetical protein
VATIADRDARTAIELVEVLHQKMAPRRKVLDVRAGLLERQKRVIPGHGRKEGVRHFGDRARLLTELQNPEKPFGVEPLDRSDPSP